MDRLYLVAGVALALVGFGCDGGGEADPDPEKQGRVNAVQAEEEKAPEPAAFCDQYRKPSEAPSFEFPELAGEPPSMGEGWVWVNVWATWCKPCIEEMPRLVEWREDLADAGLSELLLISVDDQQKKIEKFREDHPETPESLRIANPDAAPEWIESLGLGASAPLPVHIFVDPDNRVRCLRAGGIGEDDYGAVERVLGS